MSTSLPDPPDDALVIRFRNGDQPAFAILVRRHQVGLFNFAFRHLHDRTAAEDIVQEAFVRVAQNVDEFRTDALFTTWLYAIARNLCIDQFRANSVRHHSSFDAVQPGRVRTLSERTADPRMRADVERSVDGERMKGRIVAAIDALPNEQREVYLMREIADIQFKEIAKITGVSENTVKSRMRYALDRLQRALEEFEEHARALT